MQTYYIGAFAFNDVNAICHWRPKGSRNGYTTMPNYIPIGKKAKNVAGNVANFFTGNRSRKKIQEARALPKGRHVSVGGLYSDRKKNGKLAELYGMERRDDRITKQNRSYALGKAYREYEKTLPGMISKVASKFDPVAREKRVHGTKWIPKNKSIKDWFTGDKYAESRDKRYSFAKDYYDMGRRILDDRDGLGFVKDPGWRMQASSYISEGKELERIGDALDKLYQNAPKQRLKRLAKGILNIFNKIKDRTVNFISGVGNKLKTGRDYIRHKLTRYTFHGNPENGYTILNAYKKGM